MSGASERRRERRTAVLRAAWPLPVAAIALGAAVIPPARGSDSAATVAVHVRPAVALDDVRRIGINLGTWQAWGAEQLSHQVLQNPGFEGVIDRAIVRVASVTSDGFNDDAPALARPDGFWRGARFDVRTGAAAGTTGVLADSLRAGADGLPAFRSSERVPGLGPGDVVALTRIDDDAPPPRWHGEVRAVRGDVRPGSPGARSVEIAAHDASDGSLVAWLDAISARAGRMLPIDGPWRLSFWARAASDGPARVQVRLSRAGTELVSRDVALDGAWARHDIDFDGRDDGPEGTVELRFVVPAGAVVRLDDAELARRGERGPFRDEVVDALRALRPGYLRDWQGVQGTTLANRVTDPLARRATRSGPDASATFFEYGLDDVLELCRDVGAAPWIVAPTTFSDDEWRDLGRFLARRAPSSRASEVVVEFGNENWNPLSRAAGVTDPIAHAAAAERAFRLLREGAGPGVALRTALNGQFADPGSALRVLDATPSADLLAVAPYFLFSLGGDGSDASRLPLLFPDDRARFDALAAGARSARRELAVYEVNLHTTGGTASSEERRPIVAGAASGAALARRVLDAQAAGARRVAVYELAGFDAFTADRSLVRLWGVVRDLGATRRVRPSGLALRLLNRAIAGDRYVVEAGGRSAGEPGDGTVQAAAFRAHGAWSVILTSSSPHVRSVSVRFPAEPDAALPTHAATLIADDPFADNEDAERVRVEDRSLAIVDRTVTVDLPPAGLVVLLPEGVEG